MDIFEMTAGAPLFADFRTEQRPTGEVLDKYRGSLPAELLGIWEEHGFGSMMGGYLRVIDPGDYGDFVSETYFSGRRSIPIFSTAFGDIITFGEGDYIGIVRYRYGTSNLMIRTFPLFLRCLRDDGFLREYFDLERYQEALALLAPPRLDECFGYVPLLELGGSDDVKNLRVVKMREHLLIISQVIGAIGA